ncbi:hypothetical protein L6R52_14715 [Myxococcota bacterium]|nr:hypothetical protein [Myxococcota bacterium]
MSDRDDHSAGTIRRYTADAVTLRIRGLETSAVRLHIEHASGAALMVPDCAREPRGATILLTTTGFDGTRFTVALDDAAKTATVTSSAPSAILGGADHLVLARAADIVPPPLPSRRITGHESTMPIALDRAPGTPDDR